MLKKYLREPLLHFLVIGALLFVVFAFKNDGISDQSKRIIFTNDDIHRLSLLWEKQRQRPPSQTELKALIEQQVREQVMYREALAMGLDKNDSIVRRRLAQKVEFISSDLAAQIEPSESDLTEYLSRHSQQFLIPARISFVHIYLSSDKHGADIENKASRLLADLESAGVDADITKFGDSFMLGQVHKDLTETEVARLFGEGFSKKIFILPIGGWQGPVRSGFGLHLLQIQSKTQSVQAELAMVRDKVRKAWMNQQRNALDKAFYNSLRQRYDIIIGDESVKDLTVSDN